MKLLIALGVLITTIVLTPFLMILSINWLLGTAIPLTAQAWVLMWAASLFAAIPILLLLFFVPLFRMR